MLKGVVKQGLIWGHLQPFSASPCSPSKGVYIIREERSGEGPKRMTSDMKGQGI